jgi:Glyoxalase-like domain
VTEEKSVKNRVHLDLNPGADAGPAEREAEIERILALGTRRVDIGQTGDESWTVLADPEGKVRKSRSHDSDVAAKMS